MRTTIAWLAAAVVVVAVLAACRTRENFAADSASDDSSRADGTATEEESTRDPLPSEDSIRAMRPELPEARPEKRPRTWRGLKLPEEIPVRPPIEPMRRIERVPDSLQKEDSTKPPTPTSDS